MRAAVVLACAAAVLWGCAPTTQTVFEPSAPAQRTPGAQLYHVVRPGETLYRIATTYGVAVDELARANGISDPTKIAVGQKILIPNGALAASATPATPPPAEAGPASGAAPPGTWIWPVDGPVTSRFGGRTHGEWHTGVDITGPAGAIVRAARDGEVTFAGTQGRYGRLVILKHADGLTSWYAHLREFLVKVGDVVRQGDTVGRIGATGNATGPHLHLEIRREGKPMDPLTLLP